MRTTFFTIGILISTQIPALGQGAAAKLEFEVATVKLSGPLPQSSDGLRTFLGARGGPGTADPGQINIGYMTMKNLLMRAFGVKALQVSGPTWLDKTDGDHYDIVAKVPPGASKDDANVMLQNLLVERFGLAFHRETKEVQGYELTVGKNGLKMKESEIDANPPPLPAPLQSPQPLKLENDRNGIPQLPAGRPGFLIGGGPGGRSVLSARQQTVTQLANMLENRLGKPVVDKTGLSAKYDFGFAFDGSGLVGGFTPPPGANDVPSDPLPSLFTVVQQELGLRLDQKKVTVDLLVIDRVEKVPTEN